MDARIVAPFLVLLAAPAVVASFPSSAGETEEPVAPRMTASGTPTQARHPRRNGRPAPALPVSVGTVDGDGFVGTAPPRGSCPAPDGTPRGSARGPGGPLPPALFLALRSGPRCASIPPPRPA